MVRSVPINYIENVEIFDGFKLNFEFYYYYMYSLYGSDILFLYFSFV